MGLLHCMLQLECPAMLRKQTFFQIVESAASLQWRALPLQAICSAYLLHSQ